MNRVILEAFEKGRENYINLIYKAGLFWGLIDREIGNFDDKIKSNYFKHTIRILSQKFDYYDNYYFNSEFTEYIQRTFQAILKNSNSTSTILKSQILESFRSDVTSGTLFTLFRILKDSDELKWFNLSDLKIMKGILRLTDVYDTKNEMYDYTETNRVLFHFNLPDIEELYSQIKKILKNQTYSNLYRLIKLGWLRHLSENQLLNIIEEKNINFISNLSLLIKQTLTEDKRFPFEGYLSLLYKIFQLKEGFYFTLIVNKLEKNLNTFIRELFIISKNHYLPEHTIKSAKSLLHFLNETLEVKLET